MSSLYSHTFFSITIQSRRLKSVSMNVDLNYPPTTSWSNLENTDKKTSQHRKNNSSVKLRRVRTEIYKTENRKRKSDRLSSPFSHWKNSLFILLSSIPKSNLVSKTCSLKVVFVTALVAVKAFVHFVLSTFLRNVSWFKNSC